MDKHERSSNCSLLNNRPKTLLGNKKPRDFPRGSNQWEVGPGVLEYYTKTKSIEIGPAFGCKQLI